MNWKKVFRWIIGFVGILIVATLAGGYFALKTQWFHRYVLTKIIEDGQAATGGRMVVQNWDLHFLPTTVDLYGIILHGAESAKDQPLLQVEKVTVGLRLRPVLHRKLELSEILIQHPVAHLAVSANGTSNLPTLPPRERSGNTTVWSLAVGHAKLDRGEIYYNDKKTQLNADLYGLETELHFDPSMTVYIGSISYHTGRLQYANYPVMANSLDARFKATPIGFTLTSLVLAVKSSQISLRGELRNYSSPKVEAIYQIRIHTQDLAAFSPGLRAAGDVSLVGQIHYQEVPNQPFLRSVSLDGNVASSDLQAASADGRVQVRDLSAQYGLADGNLQVRGIAADVMGGRLTADLNLRQLDATPAGEFHASLGHASIESVERSVSRAEIRRMPVTGTFDAGIEGSWAASLNDIRLRGNLGLRAAFWNDSSTPRSETPIDGTIHLSYDGQHNVVSLHQSTLRTPSTSVVVDGQLGSHSKLTVHAVAGDLHELAVLASSLRKTQSKADSQLTALSGRAKLDAVVQGSIQKPRITGQLEAENLQVQGSKWQRVQLALEASPSQFKLQQGQLVNARQGNLSVNAEVGLNNWSYLSSNLVRFDLSARAMSLADLEHLANLGYPLTGTLSASISLHGSELHPVAHGSIQLVKASAFNQPIQAVNVDFQTAGDSIHSLLKLNLPAGSASANLEYTPKTKAYKVDLHTPGIALQKLQAVQAKNLPLRGMLTVSANGAGSLDNPELDVTVQTPALQVGQTAITETNAQLNVRDQRVNAALSSNIMQSSVRANATVDLNGEHNAQATIDTSKVPLDPLLALYVPAMPAGCHGETELHATLAGALKDKSRLEAHLTIPTISASCPSLEFSNAGPIRADYSNSVITLPPAEIRGTDTDLRFQGRIPIETGAAMNMQAHGEVNLALLGIFSSDVKSSGALRLDLNGNGNVRHPQLRGQIEIKDAALSTSDAPISLSKVNGTLDVTQDRVEITHLTGEAGGGQISAGGSIAYSPSLHFNVALQGKSIRILYPDGLRTVLDSNLSFTGDREGASLNGRALIDSLNFTPDFDLANFAGQFNGISIPSSNQGFADLIKLSVSLQSAQNLSARSSQLSLEGVANLQIRGTVGDPVIVGRVDLTSGELFFMSNRYQLQRGIVTFEDPNQTRPVLNVQVTSTVQQYNLTLTMTGPLERLNTNYASDPALPTADIISLIYRGETVEQASAAGTSTESMVASQAASQFSGGLQKMAGISSLQIDPLVGGDNPNPPARIAFQQRVTKNFLFTFSTDVSQPEQEIVQGEYQINKRWSVSATRDQLGGVTVDGRYHTRF